MSNNEEPDFHPEPGSSVPNEKWIQWYMNKHNVCRDDAIRVGRALENLEFADMVNNMGTIEVKRITGEGYMKPLTGKHKPK
jgi:hypothetical protein